MRECRTYGSVRGVGGNAHPYRDSLARLEHSVISMGAQSSRTHRMPAFAAAIRACGHQHRKRNRNQTRAVPAGKTLHLFRSHFLECSYRRGGTGLF